MSHRQKGRHKPRHHTHAVKPASLPAKLPALQVATPPKSEATPVSATTARPAELKEN